MNEKEAKQLMDYLNEHKKMYVYITVPDRYVKHLNGDTSTATSSISECWKKFTVWDKTLYIINPLRAREITLEKQRSKKDKYGNVLAYYHVIKTFSFFTLRKEYFAEVNFAEIMQNSAKKDKYYLFYNPSADAYDYRDSSEFISGASAKEKIKQIIRNEFGHGNYVEHNEQVIKEVENTLKEQSKLMKLKEQIDQFHQEIERFKEV